MGQSSGKLSDEEASESVSLTNANSPAMINVPPDMSRTAIDDVFECVICLDDVENAHLCPLCSKIACLKCWDQVVPRYCPNCRGNLVNLKLIRCHWIADLGSCVKELRLKAQQETTRKAELENELVAMRSQLENAPGPSGINSRPKPPTATATVFCNANYLKQEASRPTKTVPTAADHLTFRSEPLTTPGPSGINSQIIPANNLASSNTNYLGRDYLPLPAAVLQLVISHNQQVKPGPALGSLSRNNAGPSRSYAEPTTNRIQPLMNVALDASVSNTHNSNRIEPRARELLTRPLKPQPAAKQANLSNAHNLNGTNPIPVPAPRKKKEKTPAVPSFRSQMANAPGPSGIKSQPKPAPKQASSAHNLNGTNPTPGAGSISPLKGRLKLTGLEFRHGMDVVSASEEVSWLNGSRKCYATQELCGWGAVGPCEPYLSAQAEWFCDNQILENLPKATAFFNKLDGMKLLEAQSRANTFKKVKGVFSIYGSAMKMANLDAVFDFMFTKPKDLSGSYLLKNTQLLLFADLCGGPGGFSEYILWRKRWRAKGFGITLKDENDFKLNTFLETPANSFEPIYGSKGNGDICDPDNIDSFCDIVWAKGGVHFAMADGGYNDGDREKSAEIKFKRLFLCQCLIALLILKRGGHFVMKLYNLLTPFSVGLVYLMHTCFDRISIHKPNTSLPASILFVPLNIKKNDCVAVADYLWKINNRMIELEGSNQDLIHLVPKRLIKDENSEFCNYITTSNNTLAERQLIAILKIDTFIENSFLIDDRQNNMKKECLQLYGVKEIRRPTQIDPATIFKDIPQISSPDHVGMKVLEPGTLSTLKMVYNWEYCLLGDEIGKPISHPALFYSQGDSKIFRMISANQWFELPSTVGTKLPGDTLVLGVLLISDQKLSVLHIIDAARLAGEDISGEKFETRQQLCKIFVKSIQNLGNVVKHKVSRPLTTIENIARDTNLIRVGKKLENGVLFLPSCKFPWEEIGKKRNTNNFMNLRSAEVVSHCPKEAISDFYYVFQKMTIWRSDSHKLKLEQIIDFVNREK